MIDGAKKAMVESDMGNPYVAQRMNNYANYLYLMKGRQQKRYVDMVNSSINYHNQELVRAENAYKTSYTNFTNELKTKSDITKEDYTRLKTTLEEMYKNVEAREEVELKKQKLREEVYQAQYATILGAVDARSAETGGADMGFEKAKQLIVENIDKKDEDLKLMLLEKAKDWKLTVTDINALIGAIERPKQENFSEDWFKTAGMAVIVANTSYHRFDIGTIVTLHEHHPEPVNKKYRKAFYKGGYWWVLEEDCAPYEFDLKSKVEELLG
jgi:hypothetical protein